MGQVERDIGRHPFCKIKIIGLLMNTLLSEVKNGHTWPQIMKVEARNYYCGADCGQVL
jgi:hypothetical protein